MVRGCPTDPRRTRTGALGKPLGGPTLLQILGRVKAALPTPIKSLFTRHPALCGFSVLGLDEVPDSCPRGDGHSGLFVGDVGVSPTLSGSQYGEMFEEIVAAVAEILAEEPDAGESLRGRTFARALH